MEIGYPDMRSQPLLGARNLTNLFILLAVPLPSIWASAWLFSHFAPGAIPPDPGWGGIHDVDSAAAYLLHHPIVSVNVLFFFNVNVLFWLLALVQRSSWLIDPYWTLLPPLIHWFYWAHPLADPSPARSAAAWIVLGVWAVRLTHNYLRREQWRFGFREDWRFEEQRRENRHFWWYQFFYVYVVQQVLLVGLALPFWAVQFHDTPFGWVDAALTALALLGIAIAHVADTTLDRFMRTNAARVARGEPKQPLLDEGIWRWSRHPNYFGEQLFWWAVAGYGVWLGEPWVVLGTAINSAVLAAVTLMTERRMLADPARADLFRAYQARTSVWIPRPPRPVRPPSAPS